MKYNKLKDQNKTILDQVGMMKEAIIDSREREKLNMDLLSK
jgi:hypothetical protein